MQECGRAQGSVVSPYPYSPSHSGETRLREVYSLEKMVESGANKTLAQRRFRFKSNKYLIYKSIFDTGFGYLGKSDNGSGCVIIYKAFKP